MSFELVNHQIKHIFGGIEVEKNQSLQLLENWQKKITKSMEKAQANHKKVYQSIITIKSSLMELSQNYLTISKENKQGGLIAILSNQINAVFQDISQESLVLSKKMEAKVENYIPNLKKIKQKYKQSAQNLEHYRKKVSLLKKNVEKQSLANIKQQQHERYERNKQKLKKAESEYDEMLIKTTKRYLQFNNEGLKDVYNDLITIFSTIGGNVMRMGNKLTKYLCQNFGTKEILLAKELRLQKKSTKRIETVQEEIKGKRQTIKQQAIQSKKSFFEYLTEQKQISNYLKSIIDRQLFKIEPESIQDAFKQKPVQKESSQNFVKFQNIYENHHHLKQDHQTALERMKEEDPVQACEELLQIQEPTEISNTFEKEDISAYSSRCSRQKEQERYSHEEEKEISFNKVEKMKNNLEIFNKLCQQSQTNKIKSPLKPTNHVIQIISPKKFQLNKPEIHQQVLKSDDFFKLSKPQQQLSKMHEHPFNFDIFPPTKINNKHSFETLKLQPKTFTNFADFDNLIQLKAKTPNKNEQSNKDKSLPPKSCKSSRNNDPDLLK